MSFCKVRFLLLIVFFNCSACFFDCLAVSFAPCVAMANANAKNAIAKVWSLLMLGFIALMIAISATMPDPVPANIDAYFDIFAWCFKYSLRFVNASTSFCNRYALYLICFSFVFVL